jgi:hypothetical protein
MKRSEAVTKEDRVYGFVIVSVLVFSLIFMAASVMVYGDGNGGWCVETSTGCYKLPPTFKPYTPTKTDSERIQKRTDEKIIPDWKGKV